MAAALALALVASALACNPPQLAGEDTKAAPASAGDAAPAQGADRDRPVRTATIPADGWNDDIAWRGLEEGLREAGETQRPVMLVVHTSWCPKCRALKGVFNLDEGEIERLSQDFIMVHADQDVSPQVTLYAPDGNYIPRIMFLDPNGKLDEDLKNPIRAAKFRYFYTPQEDLVGTMREALDRYGNKT